MKDARQPFSSSASTGSLSHTAVVETVAGAPEAEWVSGQHWSGRSLEASNGFRSAGLFSLNDPIAKKLGKSEIISLPIGQLKVFKIHIEKNISI